MVYCTRYGEKYVACFGHPLDENFRPRPCWLSATSLQRSLVCGVGSGVASERAETGASDVTAVTSLSGRASVAESVQQPALCQSACVQRHLHCQLFLSRLFFSHCDPSSELALLDSWPRMFECIVFKCVTYTLYTCIYKPCQHGIFFRKQSYLQLLKQILNDYCCKRYTTC